VILNFAEIEDHFDFESFCASFLRAQNFKIIQGPALGADHGIDIIAEEPTASTGHGFRWAVSCKFFKNAVGSKRDSINSRALINSGCHGIMCIYSSYPTSSLEDELRSVATQNFNGNLRFFSGRDIEDILLRRNIQYRQLLAQYFPQTCQKILNKFAQNRCDCCQKELTQSDFQYLVNYFEHNGSEIASCVSDCCKESIETHLSNNDIVCSCVRLR